MTWLLTAKFRNKIFHKLRWICKINAEDHYLSLKNWALCLHWPIWPISLSSQFRFFKFSVCLLFLSEASEMWVVDIYYIHVHTTILSGVPATSFRYLKTCLVLRDFCTGSASAWCARWEVLYKSLNTIQYMYPWVWFYLGSFSRIGSEITLHAG